jgi:putative intracellular protease/amidase
VRTSRSSGSQIVAILRDAEATAATVGAICHAHGIFEKMFSWRVAGRQLTEPPHAG